MKHPSSSVVVHLFAAAGGVSPFGAVTIALGWESSRCERLLADPKLGAEAARTIRLAAVHGQT